MNYRLKMSQTGVVTEPVNRGTEAAQVSGMSNKHTPGPWKLRLLETQGKNTHPLGYKAIYDLDQPNYQGKRSAGTLIVFGPEGEANARLMEAAPRLLEALEALIECGRKDLSNPKYDTYFIEACTALAMAKYGGKS